MKSRAVLFAIAAIVAVLPSQASAQTRTESSYNVEGSVGWDIPVSGDFLAASIGTLEGFPAVIQSQSFGDVYGTGVFWQFGGGYMIDEINEVRGQFTYQRAGADVVTLGTVGTADLKATFDDYKAWTIEAGFRHYFKQRHERVRPYAGGNLGVSIITEIDAAFAAPSAGITRLATDFYDGTAAFSLGPVGGVLYALNDRIDLNAQAGLRFNSGLSHIDALELTGLEDINDKSARWTFPISVGLRFNF